jgi:hypothetical protein
MASNNLLNFNGGSITLGQVPKAIELMEVTKRSLLLQSAPGYGKSAMVYQYGEQKGYKVFAFTGGLITRSNIYGVDFIDSDRNRCTHYPAEWFSEAMDSKNKSILFLDDFGNASPQEMMVLQQILGDRKLGNYNLPVEKFLIIGATNRQNDRSNVYNISSAILNRCCVLNVRLDANEFLTHAKQKFHPSVYAFLESRKYAITNDEEYIQENQLPKDLLGFYSANSSSNSIRPSPRTWEGVSHMLYKQQSNVLSDDYIGVFSSAVSGLVGKEITPMFMKSLKGTLNIPSTETLIQNCNDGFDYATIIGSDNEAISTVLSTLYQEIGKEVIKYQEALSKGQVEKVAAPNSQRSMYVYEPLNNLAKVINKIGNTKFKSINANVLVADTWDLIISNKSDIAKYTCLVDTIFHLPFLKERMKLKSSIINSLS